MAEEILFTVRVETFLSGMAKQVEEIGEEAAKVAAEAILNAAPQFVGGKGYSGQHSDRGLSLKDSGRVEKSGGGSGAWAVVFTHEAAGAHHDGTSEHMISPGSPTGKWKVGALWNPSPNARSGGGNFFSRKTVRHPGTDPNPFLIKAANSVGYSTTSGTRIGRLRDRSGRFTEFPRSV